MKWRDIIIGFVSALLVVVIGGTVVYYLTREPRKSEPAERLVYAVEKTTSFRAETTAFTLFTLRTMNLGDLAATKVNVGIVFGDETKILDKSISLSSDPVGQYTVTKSEAGSLVVQVSSLAPDESVVLCLMLNKEPTRGPEIGVKSEQTVGKAGPIVREVERVDKKQESRLVLLVLLPILVVIQVLLVLYLRSKRREYGRNVNNTAFLYIHQGLHEEATKLLESEISQHGGDSHYLSNYALCLALSGDAKAAHVRLAAADFLATSKQEKAVFAFNRGLIALLSGEVGSGIGDLKEAMALAKKEVRKYCRFSTVVRGLKDSQLEVAEALKEFDCQ